MEKPVIKPVAPGPTRVGDGDWVCSDVDCSNVNFSRRTSCNRCGKERAELKLKKKMGTEIGKSAADKSRGLFSADDWQCNKCANVNWARRQTCNVCNAPKFGEVEARTGYGGGYNERGNVEYRPRRDSDDDEFDEFGRRKKKRSREQPDKVMSVQRKPSFSDGSQRGDNSGYQPNTYKISPAISDDHKFHKITEHKDYPERFPDYLKESRYSRSSENSTEMIKKRHSESLPKRSKQQRDLDVSTEHFIGKGSDWPSKKSNLSSPRECIMENRVSSTNEIKYRFTGKTIDENFEVVYTLEERVCAAAWAIAYMNCKVSADQFQNTFDKPAPDFKTIFAWRQRLLLTGCLVDNHIMGENSQTRSSQKSVRTRRQASRKKRARYYEQRVETTESSSEESTKMFKRKVPSSRSSRSEKGVVLEMSSQDDVQVGQGRHKPKSDSGSSDGSNSDNVSKNNDEDKKETAPHSRQHNKDNLPYNPYFTDLTRSVTPEMTNVRVDLANVVCSPPKRPRDDQQFAEDIYFEDDLSKTKSNEKVSNESQFLMPQIPKNKKIPSPVKNIEESLKSVLEDIISESERYSSDDASEKDFPSKSNSFHSAASNKQTLSENKYSTDSSPKYQPTCTINNRPDIDSEQPSKMSLLQSCSKNMSLAIRRIYERVSQSKDSDNDSSMEYVPTKINPDMAKRNYQLFNSEMDNEHELFSDNSMPLSENQIPAIKPSSPHNETSQKTANVFKIQKFEDYIPEDDALYKDGSSEASDGNNGSEDVAPAPLQESSLDDKIEAAQDIDNSLTEKDTPEPVAEENIPLPLESEQPTQIVVESPAKQTNSIAPNVSQPVETNQIKECPKVDTNVNPLASLLNINFSNINAEALAKALKDIQTLAVLVSQTEVPKTQEETAIKTVDILDEQSEEAECVEITNDLVKETTIILDDEVAEPKPANIPFLNDMFDPGTPPESEAAVEPAAADVEKITDLSNIQEPNLDDLLDLPLVRPVGSFKSFAIPKPIMLNRLKVSNSSQEQNNDTTPKTSSKKKKFKSGDNNKSKDGEEEDEESEEDGDLSKYDLWGSDEDTNKEKSETSATNNPPGSDTSEKKASEKSSASPQNNEEKRSGNSKKSGSSSRSSSSSSSSSDSSPTPAPRNKFDDFNLNSEQSRAESAESSGSRSNSRDRKHRNRSRSDKRGKRSSSDHKRERVARHARTHHSSRGTHRRELDRRHHNSHRHRR